MKAKKAKMNHEVRIMNYELCMGLFLHSLIHNS